MVAIVFVKLFSAISKFFEESLIANFLSIVKGFEVAVFLAVAVVFMFIAVGVTIRQTRRLPNSYVIEVSDLDDRQTTIDGLRQTFSTYEGAESFARFYRQTYIHQYSFKVIGKKEK